jgi:hypothetical protein
LKKIKQRTLVVKRDIMVPTINSYILQQHLPDARLILYPNSGHGSHFQFFEEFAEEAARRSPCPRGSRGRGPKIAEENADQPEDEAGQIRPADHPPLTSVSNRRRRCRLSEGCAVCSPRLAATVMLFSSATATKYRRCLSSMLYPSPGGTGAKLTKSLSPTPEVPDMR